MDVFVMPSWGGDGRSLRRSVQVWETLGVAGVLYTDHLFVSAGDDEPQRVTHGDPFVRAATVAALSESLVVGTIVANLGMDHPALVLRHFTELAVLHGGDRVLAGVGAGWNTEEFDALGMDMPRHAARSRRLLDAARLARQLFDEHVATLEGEGFAVSDLPSAPTPGGPPRLLVGGGSDFLLDVAGRYADQLDLNGSSRQLPLGRVDPRKLDGLRRVTTTVAELAKSVERVRSSAEEAGRGRDAVQFSVLAGWVEPCSPSEVASREAAICSAVGAPSLPLAECPYALVGTPERMAALLADRRDRFGLSSIIVHDGPHVEMLCSEVLPLLA
ncbi:MAG: F420-dependent oxidoreductase [Acidimicrobiaceae bacterium]|jgi:alkanesulfonate monooxygenase SsuD/methylene tetrahydromethanopterin reductase-like flavin-dependent oxidoreductase (luciferase family)|nr:F420-dependent oxidoreductase [Acidimicrobiaceae bacterium]